MKINPTVAEKYPALDDLVKLYSSRADQVMFWEDKVHDELEMVDATANKLIWEFKVDEKHCNQ